MFKKYIDLQRKDVRKIDKLIKLNKLIKGEVN